MTVSRSTLLVVAVVVAAVVAAAAAVYSTRKDEPTAAVSGQTADNLREEEERFGLTRRDADDVTALGDVDAPLVLIEYADYRCPFCGIFARDTLPVIQEEYIDTGLLRLEWRDFPVFGEESIAGAVAARAAGKQGMFWEYHHAMYEDAPERGHLDIDRDAIMGWAEKVGIPDLAAFEADLDDADLRAAVDADAEQAASLGATGTPTFMVGTQPLVGAQPLDSFRKLIEDQLAAAGERG